MTTALALRNDRLLEPLRTPEHLGAGTLYPVFDPASGRRIAEVADHDAEAARMAIFMAQLGQKAWANRSGKERAAVLRRWFDLVVENVGDLALILTSEQGKPLSEARTEVLYAASFIEWFAEEAKRVSGEIPGHPQAHQRIFVLRQPVGVCAAITPWNFPAAMVTRKVAPALAAGCSILVKPADQTPLTALALLALARQAGVPAEVFQVLTSSNAIVIGAELCASEAVRKLSFTGSTKVGRLLMAQCSPTVKRLSLELGGNAPFIVFEDADLDAAVEGLVLAKFRNAGQTCVCANRVFVQGSIYDDLLERLVRRASRLRVGPGTQPVDIGPLIDMPSVDKVKLLVHDAQARGARVLLGGAPHELGGTFFQPTVLADADASMRLAREEIFGPVAPLFRFTDERDLLAQANDTEYGLASYVYTRDLSRAWRVAEALECGMVGLNTGLISNEVGPFGGVKQSGFGREGSRLGIEEYLDVKSVTMQV